MSDQPFRLPQPCPSNLRPGGGPRNAVERRWWLCGITREACLEYLPEAGIGDYVLVHAGFAI
ncbi:MAG: HypC/HybG/HupF family hydrogenase formation chaperone, partial [Acidobacteriia bacterium]|nr:HypC/HybG/HupF family hydrogenase formation chaperone [Terriglobia bacterium]